MTITSNEVVNQIATGLNPVKQLSTLRKALPQILAVMVKNVVLISYGLTVGYITILIPALSENASSDEYRLNDDQISWIGSISMMCVPIGCLISGIVTDPIGRKRSMQIINVPFIACWIVFYYANQLWHFYFALAMSGFFGGLVEAPVLTYVSEITQPHLRGALAASSSVAVIFGIFIEFVLGTFLDWRTVALISCIFPVTSFCLLCFMPESPHWLVMNNKIDKARKSLAWLRGWTNVEAVEEEIQEICRTQKVEESQENTLEHRSFVRQKLESAKGFTKKTFLWPFSIVAFLYFLSHFTGSTTLQTYAVKLFKTLQSPIDVYYATIIMGVAELLGSFVCLFLVKYCGKRIMAFISITGVGLSDVVIGGYAYVMHIDAFASSETAPTTTNFEFEDHQWVALGTLVFLAFISHCGFRALPWILIGEVYPPEIRATGCGISGATSYLFSFASNKIFLKLGNFLTVPGIYWFYAVLSFIGLICIYFVLPETEGKPLEAITDHFSGKSRLGNKIHKKKKCPFSGNINLAFVDSEARYRQKDDYESKL